MRVIHLINASEASPSSKRTFFILSATPAIPFFRCWAAFSKVSLSGYTDVKDAVVGLVLRKTSTVASGKLVGAFLI